ncbi:MAG: TetR family transcriptional regulator [Gemmatimonadota bacterium]|nr:MAG: TetR family transcriptional regulator [Gemmatimonadota bacterium]
MTTTTKRTRKPADERREQIARTALRILGEGGRKALTTGSLAEGVSVTTGAIFRHFASLEDVLVESVRVAIEQVHRTFPDEGLEPLERIIALARNRVRLLGSDAGIAWLLRSEQASMQLPASSVRDLRQLVQRSREFLLGAIRQGIADGAIRDDVGAEELLVVVMGTIHTLVGATGVHGSARRSRSASVPKTLDALRVLLSRPGGPRSRKK